MVSPVCFQVHVGRVLVVSREELVRYMIYATWNFIYILLFVGIFVVADFFGMFVMSVCQFKSE